MVYLKKAQQAGIQWFINHVGGCLNHSLRMQKKVTCYQDVMNCDVERFKQFFHLMLEKRVYLAPSAFEAGFISIAHTKEDMHY